MAAPGVKGGPQLEEQAVGKVGGSTGVDEKNTYSYCSGVSCGGIALGHGRRRGKNYSAEGSRLFYLRSRAQDRGCPEKNRRCQKISDTAAGYADYRF